MFISCLIRRVLM